MSPSIAIAVNKPVPDFELPSTGQKTLSLSDFVKKHQSLVLYFYPKDCTSGCTLEGQQFRDLYPDFKKINIAILGVSRDTLKLHEKFKADEDFPFDLLSDSEEKLCQLFSVIKDKTMYGKKVRGIERSTFFIDALGILRQEWRGVKADGHAEEVLKFCQKQLKSSL